MVPSPVIMAAQVLAQAANASAPAQLAQLGLRDRDAPPRRRRAAWFSALSTALSDRSSDSIDSDRVCFCVRGVEPEEHQWLLLIARVLPCPRRRMVAFFRPQKAGRSRARGTGPLGSATLTSHYVGKPADPFELLFLCSREQNGFRRRDMLGAQAWHSASSRRSTPRWRRMTRTVHSTGQVEASGAALGRH